MNVKGESLPMNLQNYIKNRGKLGKISNNNEILRK